MKAIRTLALFLFFILTFTFLSPVKAADVTASALEQCAAELSACTNYKYYRNENTQRYISYRLVHPDYTLDAVISYVNIGLDRLFYSNSTLITNPKDTNVLVNKYRQLPSDFIPPRLENISSPYSYGAQRLTREARVAFEKMCAAAKKDGYPIWATSAYRSYARQAQVYSSFFNPDEPSSVIMQDLLAARPGFSEHQTGLAVDISRVNASVSSADINKWLSKNAYKYGFIIRYTAGKEGVTGYTNEPWHLRYLGVSLATSVYSSGLTYDEYYVREIDIPVKSTDITAIGVTAISDITVNGTPYKLSVYRILGDTYYKLRDIAAILSGTSKSFDITWDEETRRIGILQGVLYSAALTPNAAEAGLAALVTEARPELAEGGTIHELNSYVADGANYFRLDDILDILGIAAAEDGAGYMCIDTMNVHSSQPAT